MHRIASFSGDISSDEFTLVEQPQAPVLFLSSAATDISTLATALDLEINRYWVGKLRALPLDNLAQSSQVDHYLSTTGSTAHIIVIRLIGSRGHWGYGLEQVVLWQQENNDRKLLILAGTNEQKLELNEIGNFSREVTDFCSELFIEGGIDNTNTFLCILNDIVNNKKVSLSGRKIARIEDPLCWDWQNEKDNKVGIIFYRSLYQAGDLNYPTNLNYILRTYNLAPRTVFVSSLRNKSVQQELISLFRQEEVEVILTNTSFASVNFQDVHSQKSLLDILNVPVLQLLNSSSSKSSWLNSSIGLSPLDLTLQIAIPELDARISTRPCSFREKVTKNESLATVVSCTVPHLEGIDWIAKHAKSWSKLRNTDPADKRIALVISNYPPRNGRLANGVGLDTPNSIIQILNWLKTTNHDLGPHQLPKNSQDLLKLILQTRTNDHSSQCNEPLDYLELSIYREWFEQLTKEAQDSITKRWGEPSKAIDLETKGFAINGIVFGKVVLLIQPSRGYDQEDIADIHSPVLPPTHRYLAQYLWIKKIHEAHILVHIGKHGSLEWLPGKGVGLSNSCHPNLAIGHIPNIYPFIVNDPGEGSQAKRRSNSIIIDHLTPPMTLSGLYGDYLVLESLLDEYYEAKSLNLSRIEIVKSRIKELTSELQLPLQSQGIDPGLTTDDKTFHQSLVSIDSYLCELKHSQIRQGLHIFGKHPELRKQIELLFCIVLAPTSKFPGITQQLAKLIGLIVDPWNDCDDKPVSESDKNKIYSFTGIIINSHSDILDILEEEAKQLLVSIISTNNIDKPINYTCKMRFVQTRDWINRMGTDPYLNYIRYNIWPKLTYSVEQEKQSFISAISGHRVTSGPSGAPTRGNVDIFPTGRNFYSVDLRALPTESAWSLGEKSAKNILDLFLLENGDHLMKLAMSVWGTSTMRNGGEDIAQLLALIGIKPIWDGPTRRMIDIEVIPLSVLNRPRVDVTLRISGLFRDSFPQLIDIVHRAQSMIGRLDEVGSMNPLAASYRQNGPQGRIYGSAPGAYGAGLQELIESGHWTDSSDLGAAFIEWSKWNYDGVNEPVENKSGLNHLLSDIQVVLHNQDNREHDILDSDDYYQFHGGLSAAVENNSGSKPFMVIADHSRQQRPKAHSLQKEIDKVMRSRVLNPVWIEGIKNHGYKGAFEMSATVDYLFAYDAATDVIPDWCYQSIVDKWISDSSIITFMVDNNPWALRDIAERLLESHNRGLWENASESSLDLLRKTVNQSEAIIEQRN